MSDTREQLLARYRSLGTTTADAAAQGPGGSPVVASAPTDVHRAAIELLDELLGLVPHDAPPFGSIVRTLRRLEPILLRDFAKVPEENVALFLRELGNRMIAAASRASAPSSPALAPAPSVGEDSGGARSDQSASS